MVRQNIDVSFKQMHQVTEKQTQKFTYSNLSGLELGTERKCVR